MFPSEFREEFTQLGAEEAQRVAKTKGVEDPPFDNAPSYCALGDTSDVPTG
ncbi:hypothetical protein BN1012_Phect1412 [Candidatus Phaeomarinobacter ectocarpi]|uniref:Uncharacterized protein n=1 Tax=Candidatus Phaeomarinibacter ectocarpi TaxID=1458461 RepID=X5MMY0_9HYPH|nr:hypothetical protein BN1012_Phect1412 [Candidatus Phaeomarinobacter ectocarpi]